MPRQRWATLRFPSTRSRYAQALRYALSRRRGGVLGYLCIPLPNALGIDLRWGAVGLTTAAGLGGWAEFLLLRRKLNNRIGRTGLPLPFIAKLWTAAVLAAAIGWAIKLFVGVDRPILTALAVLGPTASDISS